MISKVPSVSEDFKSIKKKVWHSIRQNFLTARTATTNGSVNELTVAVSKRSRDAVEHS